MQVRTNLITESFSLHEPLFLLLHGHATPDTGIPSGIFRFSSSSEWSALRYTCDAPVLSHIILLTLSNAISSPQQHPLRTFHFRIVS